MGFRKKKEGLTRTALLLIFLLAVSFSSLSGQEQPPDPVALRAKAEAFLAQEDYRNAIATNQELIGVTETQAGLTDTAREDFKNHSRYQISLAYYKQREYQKAIAEADKITTGAYLDSAYYLKGYCCQSVEKGTRLPKTNSPQFPSQNLY